VADTDAPLPWRRRARRATAGFLSPAVRRLAAEQGVDPSAVEGTGLGGRVTRADVRAAAAPPRGDEALPFNRIRARAATALVESKRAAAHALVTTLADYSAVERARRPARERWRADEGFALTYLPFVAVAVVAALRELPLLNAHVGDDVLDVAAHVNLGVAVDLDHEGLVVPVVHGAEGRSLRGIARAIDDVARRARSRALTPDDVTGGTFTLTNPGAHGTWVSVPIINRPQAAILSTDGVAKRVVATDGRVEIRPVGHLCMSFDHRAVDGAYAGTFLRRVREVLETRDWSAAL
jgi:2-oxoglutarate dehydrogenase E2 component (dihydrolipoamide succinyltransferase)